MNYSCDVWWGEGIMEQDSMSLRDGKKLMRKLRAEGKECIRMYVDYDSGKRLYYSFDKLGKIISESNNFNN